MKHTKILLILASVLAMGCTDRANPPIFKKPSVPRWKVKTNKVFTKKPIVVAVIDTGIADDFKNADFLCKFGHKDFTGKGLTDNHGHGTHVTGLIDQYAKGLTLKDEKTMLKLLDTSANYCQVILKYWDPTSHDGDNLKRELDALRYAINIKVNVINFSGGGEEFSQEEKDLIVKALNNGIKVVVAAGNEKSDISKAPYYPAALDDRLYVVGNLSRDRVRAISSNFGSKVNVWEYGTQLLSYAGEHKMIKMTGTSQATAIKSGKLVHEMLIER